jgi:hypothetical protein
MCDRSKVMDLRMKLLRFVVVCGLEAGRSWIAMWQSWRI